MKLAAVLLALAAMLLGCAAQGVADKQAMIGWMGGSVHKAVALTQAGQLVVQANVSAETELLRVPAEHIMSVEAAVAAAGKASPPLAGLLQANVSEEAKLALWLLSEARADDSSWKPYVVALNKRRHSSLFFTGDEVAALQASVARSYVETAQSGAEAVRTTLVQAAQAAQQAELAAFLSADRFRWALGAVWSTYVRHPSGKLLLLPAIGDLPHARGAPFSLTLNEDGSISYSTTAAVAAGSVLQRDHGITTNAQLLLEQSTSELDTPAGSARLTMRLPGGDLLAEAKLRLLAAAGVRELAWDIPMGAPLPPSLFLSLRVALMTAADLPGFNVTAAAAEPISMDNERAVLVTLRRLAQQRLAQYGTTLEEDRKLLADEEKRLSSNMRAIVQLRATEKAILTDLSSRFIDASWMALLKQAEAEWDAAEAAAGAGK